MQSEMEVLYQTISALPNHFNLTNHIYVIKPEHSKKQSNPQKKNNLEQPHQTISGFSKPYQSHQTISTSSNHINFIKPYPPLAKPEQHHKTRATS